MQKRGDRGDVLVLILGAFFPLGDCLYLALPLRNIFDKTKNAIIGGPWTNDSSKLFWSYKESHDILYVNCLCDRRYYVV